MPRKASRGLSADIVETQELSSVSDLCLRCQVEAEWIAKLVEHGALEPIGRVESEWLFASVSVVRIAKAKRLERDFELNPPGIALVLDLLDQLDELQSRLALHRKVMSDSADD